MGTLKWNMIDEIIIQVENLYWHSVKFIENKM